MIWTSDVCAAPGFLLQAPFQVAIKERDGRRYGRSGVLPMKLWLTPGMRIISPGSRRPAAVG
jgi:hypothetical protein